MPIRGADPADVRVDSDEWPKWAPYGSAAIAFVTLGIAFYERFRMQPRHAFVLAVAAGLIALSPFLLDSVALLMDVPVAVPLPTFPLPVVIGVAYLVFHPVPGDFAPFLLVFMTGETVSRARDRMWIGAMAAL